MAAWSDHESMTSWADEGGLYTRRQPGGNRKPVSTPDATTLHPCPTCNTAMSGECSQCVAAKRPLSEASDETLELLVDHPLTAEGERERVQAEIDRRKPEPFPLEVWTFFSDEDLDQLVVDARAEMGRREIARRSA